jgi:hypothetical protein
LTASSDPDSPKPQPPRNPEVLNDQPEVGAIGTAHSSGGGGSARFIRPGMEVFGGDGSLIGVVAAVEGPLIRLERAEGDDSPSHVPINLVDGVDDARVILSGRDDGAFGLGANP